VPIRPLRIAQLKRRTLLLRSALLAALALAWLVVGLSGAWHYWRDYYLHRGFAPVKLAKRASPGRQLSIHFYSPALGHDAHYLIFLPPGYGTAGLRYPVIYLLHGSPGAPRDFQAIGHIETRLENLIALRRVRPMILVMPDGRIDGSDFSDSEWANTPAGNYESYVLDVVENVDRRFATLAGRTHRMLAGLSAGGYGALNIALHNLPVFGSVEVWSGYFRETRSGPFAHATARELYRNSPIEYVSAISAQLRRYPLRAFIYAGASDPVHRFVATMAAKLRAAGADASAAVYPGGHDWRLWNAHMAAMLELASAWLYESFHRPPAVGGGAPPTGPGRVSGGAASNGAAANRPTASGPARFAAATAPLRRPPLLRHAAAPRSSSPALALLGGLLLALASAALINLGFLLQHRGLARAAGKRGALRAALANRTWLLGQGLGWAGFLAQMVAVSLAPLSLVQAFAAGGLALSVPLAAGLFGHRISRPQQLAVLAMAGGLACLPVALRARHDHLDPASLAALLAALAVAGAATSLAHFRSARALAAGFFYGGADAAIKAISLGWRAHGTEALLSAWTAVAALGTFAGFLAFQSALRRAQPVSAISLMTAASTLAALGCGLLAFGESLGRGQAAVLGHVAAIALVLCCVPVLAAAQLQLAGSASRAPRQA